MKQFKLTFLVVFAMMIVSSCSKNHDVLLEKSYTMVELELPSLPNYKSYSEFTGTKNYQRLITINSAKSNKSIQGSLEIRLNNQGQLHSLSISKNIISNDSIKRVIELRLENVLLGKSNSIAMGIASDPIDPKTSPHTACIEACKDKYTNDDGTKKKGRGACKANCWVDTVIRILDF